MSKKNSALKTFFNEKLRADLCKQLELPNVNQAPRLEKIVLNYGAKDASNSKLLNLIADGLTKISGQKSVKTKAKKSIAGFKIREGMTIGAMVTMRGFNMYNFLEKLVRIVIPTIRDFRGVKASFDESGNYNLGISDWMIFPEMDYDTFGGSEPRGLNITFHIKNGSKQASFALLKGFGMPFVAS